MSAVYTAEFYAGQSSRSLTSAHMILGELFKIWKPTSIVDVGCGVGPWLRTAQDLGVAEIVGLDGAYVERSALLIPADCFIPIDLERERLGSAIPDRTFGLAISVEVAEHLPYQSAADFVKDLCALSDVVLFSAAIPFQGGARHLNEQWPEFWALLFQAEGFACLDPIRKLAWARPDVDWWYAQNTLLFVRQNSPAALAFASHHMNPASGRPPLALVHPSNYLAQILKWFHTHRFVAAAEEEADFAALTTAWLRGDMAPPPLQAIARAAAEPDRPDIFPNTRIARSEPEQLLNNLHHQLALARAQTALLPQLEAAQEQLAASNQSLGVANEALAAANAALSVAANSADARYAELKLAHADLLIEFEILQTAHNNLRADYARPKPSADALVAEMEQRLIAARDEFNQLASELTQKLARWESSRIVRLAKFYYHIYGQPRLGAPLRLMRRAAGSAMRLISLRR